MAFHQRQPPSKKRREPPLLLRGLWKALKDCAIDDVPQALDAHYKRSLFTSSSKGELAAWADALAKCETWLQRWLDEHGVQLAFADPAADDTQRGLCIPTGVHDREALKIVSFLSTLVEHSRNKAAVGGTQATVRSLGLLLNSPSVDVVQEALMILHWYAGSQRWSPFGRKAQHKLVSLAAGWGYSPSLLQATGLEPFDPSTEPHAGEVRYEYFLQTYQQHGTKDKESNSLHDAGNAPVLARAAEWMTFHVSPTGQTTLTIDIARAMAEPENDESGLRAERPLAILQYILARENLTFQHAYPLWTRIRCAVDLRNPEKLQRWSICRIMALAVLASSTDNLLRSFLLHCSDWFQKVQEVLSDDRVAPGVLCAVLHLLTVLLSSANARESLNVADLRGSALCPSTLTASQGRLLDLLHEAPAGMVDPAQHADGALRADYQSMHTALFGFASVFALSQAQSSNVHTLNTAILVPFLKVTRLRVPGTEKVAAKCLSVIENLLAQDQLREQVIDAGCTQQLLALLEEEVFLVDVDAPQGAADDLPTCDEATTPIPDMLWALHDRAKARRRLPLEREVVLAHILRALALCIGSQGAPMALFSNPHCAKSLKRILENPVAYGQPVFTFAALALISLMNTDHTVCRPVLDAGFLDVVVNIIHNPPEDSRFVLVLPQLLTAFCLNKKGVEGIKKAEVFKHIFKPLVHPQTWYTLSQHAVTSLGTEIDTLIRHGVSSLSRECAAALYGHLETAVKAFLEWTPGADTAKDMKAPYILSRFVLLMEPLHKCMCASIDASSTPSSKAVTSLLLQAVERVSRILSEVNMSVAGDGKPLIDQNVLSLCQNLRTHLLGLFSGSEHNAAVWEAYAGVELASRQLGQHCYNVAKWDEEDVPDELQGSSVPHKTPSPYKGLIGDWRSKRYGNEIKILVQCGGLACKCGDDIVELQDVTDTGFTMTRPGKWYGSHVATFTLRPDGDLIEKGGSSSTVTWERLEKHLQSKVSFALPHATDMPVQKVANVAHLLSVFLFTELGRRTGWDNRSFLTEWVRHTPLETGTFQRIVRVAIGVRRWQVLQNLHKRREARALRAVHGKTETKDNADTATSLATKPVDLKLLRPTTQAALAAALMIAAAAHIQERGVEPATARRNRVAQDFCRGCSSLVELLCISSVPKREPYVAAAKQVSSHLADLALTLVRAVSNALDDTTHPADVTVALFDTLVLGSWCGKVLLSTYDPTARKFKDSCPVGVVKAFDEKDGIDLLFTTCARVAAVVLDMDSAGVFEDEEDKKDSSAPTNVAIGGLKLMLKYIGYSQTMEESQGQHRDGDIRQVPPEMPKKILNAAATALLPLWQNPRLRENPALAMKTCEVVGAIVKRVDFGSGSPAITAKKRAPRPRKPVFAPNEEVVTQLTEMGFTRPRVLEALRSVDQNNTALALEWLIMHSADDDDDAPAGGDAPADTSMEPEPASDQGGASDDDGAGRDDEASASPPTPQKEPALLLAEACVDTALALSVADDDLAYCTADVLAVYAEASMNQKAVVTALYTMLARTAGMTTARNTHSCMLQLGLLLGQPVFRIARAALARHAGRLQPFLAHFEEVVKGEGCREKDVTTAIAFFDSVTLPLTQEGGTTTSKEVAAFWDDAPEEVTGATDGDASMEEGKGDKTDDGDASGLASPKALREQPRLNDDRMWDILLATGGGRPVELPEDVALALTHALITLLFKPDIQATPLQQVLSLLDRLARQRAACAAVVEQRGVVRRMLEVGVRGAFDTHAVAAHAASLIRSSIEDADYVRYIQETAIRRAFHKLLPANPSSIEVCWVPKSVYTREAEHTATGTPRGKEDGGGEGDTENRHGKMGQDNVPLVRLTSLLSATDSAKKRDPARFMESLTACCKLVMYTRKKGSKPVALLDLKTIADPQARSAKRQAIRKQVARRTDDIVGQLLQTLWARGCRKDEKAHGHADLTHTLSEAQVWHLVGEMILLYPSVLPSVLGAEHESGTPLVRWLITQTLPYTSSPTRTPVGGAALDKYERAAELSKSLSARFLLQQLAAKSPQQVAPELVRCLALSVDGTSLAGGVGMIHALADVIVALLARSAKAASSTPPQGKSRSDASMAVAELFKHGLVKHVCDALAKLDLDHPDAGEAAAALLKLMSLVPESQAAKENGGADEKADAEGGEAGAADAAGGFFSNSSTGDVPEPPVVESPDTHTLGEAEGMDGTGIIDVDEVMNAGGAAALGLDDAVHEGEEDEEVEEAGLGTQHVDDEEPTLSIRIEQVDDDGYDGPGASTSSSAYEEHEEEEEEDDAGFTGLDMAAVVDDDDDDAGGHDEWSPAQWYQDPAAPDADASDSDRHGGDRWYTMQDGADGLANIFSDVNIENDMFDVLLNHMTSRLRGWRVGRHASRGPGAGGGAAGGPVYTGNMLSIPPPSGPGHAPQAPAGYHPLVLRSRDPRAGRGGSQGQTLADMVGGGNPSRCISELFRFNIPVGRRRFSMLGEDGGRDPREYYSGYPGDDPHNITPTQISYSMDMIEDAVNTYMQTRDPAHVTDIAQPQPAQAAEGPAGDENALAAESDTTPPPPPPRLGPGRLTSGGGAPARAHGGDSQLLNDVMPSPIVPEARERSDATGGADEELSLESPIPESTESPIVHGTPESRTFPGQDDDGAPASPASPVPPAEDVEVSATAAEEGDGDADADAAMDDDDVDDLDAQLALALRLSLAEAEQGEGEGDAADNDAPVPAQDSPVSPVPEAPAAAAPESPATPAVVHQDPASAAPATDDSLMAALAGMEGMSELEQALALSMLDHAAPVHEAPSAAETPATPAVDTPAPAAPDTGTQATPQGAGGENDAAAAASAAEPAIDPTFLAALPEDMRREILRENVHLLMTRDSPGDDGSTVDPTFLAALPQVIRQEVFEVEQRILRQREANAASTAAPQTDMDPASFMASLHPGLRQDILSTSDDAFLAALPPELAAEAHSLRARHFGNTIRTTTDSERAPHHNVHASDGDSAFTHEGLDRDAYEVRNGKATLKAAKKIPPKPIIDAAAIPAFLRILYIEAHGPKKELGKQLLQALTAVTANPQILRTTFAYMLHILSSGTDGMEKEAPLAALCVRQQTFGTPSYLAGTDPQAPSQVPPVVLLCVVELLKLLSFSKTWFQNALDAEGRAIVTFPPETAARVAAVRSSMLYRLLQCHASPAFQHSPRLSEALARLVQASIEDLCRAVDLDSMVQTFEITLKLNRERVGRLESWHEAHAATLMRAFDFDGADADHIKPESKGKGNDGANANPSPGAPSKEVDEAVRAKLQRAFEMRASIVKQNGVEIRRRKREVVRARRQLVKHVEPTAVQEFAGTLFMDRETLRAVVRVLETPDTTSATITNCVSALNAMCAAKIPEGVLRSGDGCVENVGHMLLAELLAWAERIAPGAAAYLDERTKDIKEGLERHIASGALPPSPTRGDGTPSAPDSSAPPPQPAHFFVADEPPTHEAQVQKLVRTLASISHHDHVTEVEEDSLCSGPGAEDGVDITKVTPKDLQGKWRNIVENWMSPAGGVIYVKHNYAFFEKADGTYQPPASGKLHEVEGGGLKVCGARMAFYNGRHIEWENGTIWRREDETTQHRTYPKCKDILKPVWKSVEGYLRAVGNVVQTVGEGYQIPARVQPLVDAYFAFHEVDPMYAQQYPTQLPMAPGTPLLPERGDLLEWNAMPGRQISSASGFGSGLPRDTDGLLKSSASFQSLTDTDNGEGRDPIKHFIVSNKKLLNSLAKSSPALLGTSLKPMMMYSSSIDFSNKRTWFREQIKRDQQTHYRQQRAIKVTRQNVFHDSFVQLRGSPAELKGKLRVTFKGEEGVDGGGLMREWFQVLAQEMFNPAYALFLPSNEGNTFQPNPQSEINHESAGGFRIDLAYFNFVGRVVGLAVYNEVLLDAYFTRSFYKHMLGMLPDYRDIQSIDPDYYKSLVWMLENDIDGVVDYDFTVDVDNFGVAETHELCPDGRNKMVTNQNKHEYVQLVAEYKMTETIRKQLQEFLAGFYEIVPRELIQIFSPEELELLICGTPEVDIADLKANTDYVGYTKSSPQIAWFWRAVDEMSHEERLLLLQFITGTSKMPLGGFKDLEGMTGKQKFSIQRIGDPAMLPSAHTCFNQLDMPEYDSYDVLNDKLRKAVLMGNVGFGFI